MPRSSKPAVLAGYESVPGIGEVMASSIMEDQRTRGPFDSWTSLISVYGIGLKKIETIKQFCESDDPFGLERTDKILDKVLKAISDGEIDAPLSSHDGEAVADEVAPPWGSKKKGKVLVYMGIVKARIYQDIVENIHSRTGDDLDEIEANLKNPELRKYCVLQCFDGTQEEVYIRINRFTFPRFRRRLETVEVGHDVVIGVGRKTPGFGNSIAIDKLYVIDPD